jgi:hypothetical protein
VSPRPLALLCGLTIGDSLLWNWSLNGDHGVLALVAGLSLPPLAVACVALLAVNLGRLLARSARHARMLANDRRLAEQARRYSAGHRAAGPAAAGGPADQPTAPAKSSSAPSSGKLAA